MTVSDEKLMAFADGALSDAEASEVAAALAAEPELGVKVDAMRRTSALLSGAFAGQLDIEIPARLLEPFAPGNAPSNVAHFPIERSRQIKWASVAAAACVLLGYGLGRVLPTGGNDLLSVRGDRSLVAASDLRDHLERATSGDTEGDIRIALTFPDAKGSYCRVFRVDNHDAAGLAGLACKEAGEWSVIALGEAPPSAPHEGLARAAADLPEALLQVAADRQGGDALDAAGEAAALRNHWKRKAQAN